jgi:hypothetical protein
MLELWGGGLEVLDDSRIVGRSANKWMKTRGRKREWGLRRRLYSSRLGESAEREERLRLGRTDARG